MFTIMNTKNVQINNKILRAVVESIIHANNQ